MQTTETKLHFMRVKTRVVNPPKDEIWDIIDNLDVRDGDIIFITSKILGIHQGRCVPMEGADKLELIEREAQKYRRYESPYGPSVNLTITDNILICAAGIDESNANGHYIMWPKNVDALCREIRERLVRRTGARNIGVVSTDSHTQPLRWGVTGITTSLAGVSPLRDIRGDADIFGRTMKMTQVNLIDPLTGIAVLLMGESAETTPIVILRGYTGIPFDDAGSMKDFLIRPEDDLYRPMLEWLDG
ncbi:MAG: coenzyme F420-0:L-glutamate ligase [Rickettsiales bacterium]|jgi:F420-0:gamma-glutamyl ligase|nr:coenzyme F420-0:L-glutamate ligase [Rickettsiales bacterium]